MSIDTWDGVSGNWNTGSLWSGGNVPGASDTAVLTGTAAYSVSLQASDTVGGLVINDPSASLEVATSGTFSVLGTIALSAGALELSGTLAHATLLQTGRDIAIASTVLDGDTIDGSFALISPISVKDGLNFSSPNGGLGELTLAMGDGVHFLDNETLSNALIVANGADTIDSTGFLFTLSKTSVLDGFGSTKILGTFDNKGSIEIANSTILSLPGIFTNEGTISSGSMTTSQISGVIGGSDGILEIGALCDLQIDNAVSSGQTASFSSANGTLTLEEPGSFAASIAGFKAGDVVDAVGATTGTASGDTVTLFSGSNEIGTLSFSNSVSLNVTSGAGAVTITAGSAASGSNTSSLSSSLPATTNDITVGNNNKISTGFNTHNFIVLGSGDVISSSGADTFVGGTGTDTIRAEGNALVFTNAPLTFTGLSGQSTIVLGSDGQVSGGIGAVTVFGGNGALNASGGALGGNVLVAGSGNATLSGGTGPKPDIMVGGSAGSTDQYTTSGTLTAVFTGAATGQIIDYSKAQYVVGGTGADTINQFMGAEGIIMGSGDMVLNQYSQVTVHTPRPVAATASAGMRWPSALVKFQEGACGAERIGFYAMHALPEPCRTEGYQKVRTCGYVAG